MSEETSVAKEKSQKRKYEQTTAPKEAKKPPMPVYGKYNILKMLKENHCLIADEDQLINAFPRNKRYNLDEIKGFVNKTAQKSQAITEKSNKTKDFQRATDLIRSIEECSPFTERKLDIPLSLKTITDVFNYTDEEVDVRMLYQTLTNLSLGFPTGHLDRTTSDFLYGVYKEFMDQVDTPAFQEDVKKYQESLNDNVSEDRPDVKHPTDYSDMEFVNERFASSRSIDETFRLIYAFCTPLITIFKLLSDKRVWTICRMSFTQKKNKLLYTNNPSLRYEMMLDGWFELDWN